MKSISFSDIKKVSWLQGYSEVMLLSVEMDEKVNKVLELIGIDTEYGVQYYAAKHRNLSGDIVLGYMAAGEVQINRKHLTSPFADLSDILVASAYLDTSLTLELAELSGKSRSYDGYDVNDIPDYDSKTNLHPDQMESDWLTVAEQIKSLNDLCTRIRGPQNSDSGALKTGAEYMQWFEQNKGIK